MCNQEMLRIFVPLYTEESDKKHAEFVKKLKRLNKLDKIRLKDEFYYKHKIEELEKDIEYYKKQSKIYLEPINKQIDELVKELSDAGY